MLAEPKPVRIWAPLPGEREIFRDRGALAGLRVAYVTNDPPKPFVVKIHEDNLDEYCHGTDSKGRTPMSIIRATLGKITGCGIIVMACSRGVIPGHIEVYDQRGNLIKVLAF